MMRQEVSYAPGRMRRDALEHVREPFLGIDTVVRQGRIRRLQDIVSQEVTGLLGGKVDVLFFDVTTLSFASDSEDELRKKGYSKDGTGCRWCWRSSRQRRVCP